jgi:hypothetical protein
MDRMRNFDLTDASAKAIIYDAFMGSRAVMPMRLIDDIHRLYFADEKQAEMFPDRSLWSLNNAFTEGVKELKANPQVRAGLEIGRFFADVLQRRDEFCAGRRLLGFESRTASFAGRHN